MQIMHTIYYFMPFILIKGTTVDYKFYGLRYKGTGTHDHFKHYYKIGILYYLSKI